MAKLFQLYDPLKDGKGVKKDAPKKKAFFEFFEIYFANFWKLMTAGFLSLAFSLLVLPSGVGVCGITNITRSATRRRPFFTVSDFFDTIKKNWKQALGVSVINTFITALLLFDMYYFFFMKGNDTLAVIGFAGALVAHILFCGMKYYMYMLMITFNFSIKQLFKNSFNLTFINWWRTLLVEAILLLLYAIPISLFYLFGATAQMGQIMVILYLVGGLVFFPGFKSFLTSWISFPVIKKIMIDPYYEKNPDKDIEKRRELGILEDDPKAEDRIFND